MGKKAGNAVWSGPPEVTLLDKDGKDVTTIAQSNACLRFVGSLSDGLYPANLLDRVRIDGILDSFEDLLTPYVSNYAYATGDAKVAAAKKLCETYDYWFGKLDARLEENEKRGCSNGFFVGNALTIADLFKKFERLNAFRNMMSEHKEIKAAQAQYQAK